MPSRPWYKWYPGDWIADTRMLSLEEKGAYRELLDELWLRGSAPVCARFLGRLWNIHGHSARRLWNVLEPFFTVQNGRITHEKLERQRAEAIEKSNKAKKAGRKGGVANAVATRARARSHPRAGPEPEPERSKPTALPISEAGRESGDEKGNGIDRELQAKLQADLEERRRERGISDPIRPAAVTALAALSRSEGGSEEEENG